MCGVKVLRKAQSAICKEATHSPEEYPTVDSICKHNQIVMTRPDTTNNYGSFRHPFGMGCLFYFLTLLTIMATLFLNTFTCI